MSGMKVAIIGAGVSGLAAIKSCLEENLHPVCFEQFDDIGGVWYFTEERQPNQNASCYEDLVTNTSKEFTSYSDFPFPADQPNHLTHAEFKEYLNTYADRFNLRKHIRLRTTVRQIGKSEDHDVTQAWNVHFTSSESEEKMETFQCVMICSGRNVDPIYPDIPGLDSFSGVLQHSIEFRSGNRPMYKDKNILVIGNSHTAGDMATACNEHAKKVVLAIGRGTMLISRRIDGGLPADTLNRRVFLILPSFIVNRIIKRQANAHIDHRKYGLETGLANPQYGPFCVNDTVPNLIRDGSVIVKRQTEYVDRNEVHFDDGSKHEFDVIITATGYDVSYKFIDPSLICDSEGRLKLYRLVWPIGGTSRRPSLALIGCHWTRGSSAIPGFELEARWAAAVFAEQLRLPPIDAMEQEFISRTKRVGEVYGNDKIPTPPYTVLEFQDEIAAEIGVKPTFFGLLKRGEFYLACQVTFGPAFNAQYRLLGRNSWDGAALACKTAHSRVIQGISSDLKKPQNSSWRSRITVVLINSVIIGSAYCIFLRYK